MFMTPPFRHHATVERDGSSGVDGWNNPKPPAFEVLNADLRCDYWAASEILIEGADVNAALESTRMLVPKTADIVVGDEVAEIRNEAGATISRGRLRVVSDLPMEPSHRELRLELASTPRAES